MSVSVTKRTSRALFQLRDHGPDNGDLGSVLTEIVKVGIAPPVPAALRVDRVGLDLRKEDDEAVRVGNLGVTGFLDEVVADRLARLLAAMEDDMDAAACLRGAVGRDVDHALVGEPIGRLSEGLLVEHDEPSLRLSSGRLERTIDPSKYGLGLIVVAVADIGLGADAASRSTLLGDEGVAALALHQRDVGVGHADDLEEV